jgi:hypothetical protein
LAELAEKSSVKGTTAAEAVTQAPNAMINIPMHNAKEFFIRCPFAIETQNQQKVNGSGTFTQVGLRKKSRVRAV